ncbi:MAG TPA: LuxR C-terminal-related transcriptional regulator [Gaiellaceae bacterium]
MVAARGQGRRLKSVFARSPVPMVMVDDERRYVEVNQPARFAFRLSLAEMRKRRIDSLTPRESWPLMEAAWSRLIDAGCVAGPYEVQSPDGSRWEALYYGLANALPGLHVIAFAPATALDIDGDEQELPEHVASLTGREVELLQLAAEGLTGPRIAEELALSPATVKKHFEHIYAKLAVGDRAAAVATAMRHGLIS